MAATTRPMIASTIAAVSSTRWRRVGFIRKALGPNRCSSHASAGRAYAAVASASQMRPSRQPAVEPSIRYGAKMTAANTATSPRPTVRIARYRSRGIPTRRLSPCSGPDSTGTARARCGRQSPSDARCVTHSNAATRAGGRHNGPVIARSRLARRLMGNHVPGRGALLLVLVLAGSTSGCGNSSPRGSATGTFTLANDTTSTVSVRDCLAASCDSGAATTLAPARSETLPMSGQGPGSAASMLLITGDGSGPRCVLIPPNVLPEPLRLAVTDATSAQCAGWAPLPVPDLTAFPPINPSSNG
jgi:hypothetical protein